MWYACIHGEGAAASGCACEFSPLVEELDPGTVVVDASGLDRLFGSPRELASALARRFAGLGFTGSIAIASNPDAAVHAARGIAGVTVIPRGEEAARLAALPVEMLSPTPEMQETLDCWGIRTFRDFAALPETGVAERLGPEGVRLQKLARGQWQRPLRPVTTEPAFEEAVELDYPLTELEPLSFVLSTLLHRLCASLESRALAAIEIRLTLKLENKPDHARAIRLPVPMLDVKILLKLLQLELTAHPPGAPILAVALHAAPAKPRPSQAGLYTPPTPEPEKLELTLARIAAVVGKENVGSPRLLDTHRPSAFRTTSLVDSPSFCGAGCQPARRLLTGATVDRLEIGPHCRNHRDNPLALRLFRPPLPARVQAPEARPAHISARGMEGKVLTLAGPWRISGDWWTSDPWARDEWDVALSDGALYRIYFERPSARWFVEGSYD
jgi:protein ImuB